VGEREMTNPLIEKYNEIHNPKPPEPPKPVEKPKLSKLTTYDPDSVNVSFQQIAEKIQQGKALVASMSMEMGYPIGECYTSKTLTFEVRVYD
jgi:hypothetical protein